MRKLTAVGIGLAVATFGFGAMAQEAGGSGFGRTGQIALGGDLELSFTSTSQKAPNGGNNPDAVTTIVIGPALDYFVADNISVGGKVFYSSSGTSDNKTSGFGIGPRVGYNIAINDRVSFWPRLGITYESISVTSNGNSGSGSTISLNVWAPFLIHLAPHFFVGIGPEFNTDLSAKVEGNDATKTTVIGVTTAVGGYF